MDKSIHSYMTMLRRLSSMRKIPDSGQYRWKKVDPDSKGKREVRFGICGCCSQKDCATLVHLEDGIVVKVEGNPDSPPNFGTLCGKGRSEILSLYNPYRIKSPLVRTNPEKGLDVDPGWKEVSWDKALDIVAERLKEVRQNDPRGLVLCGGFGNKDSNLRDAFLEAFGSPNHTATHGELCSVHYATCLVQAGFTVSIVDLEHCRYHITLGRSLGPNFATTSGTRRLVKALDRGMKLVVVDPRCSFEASKGDWVPIRPGTDLAFLLAMAHVMLFEIQTYDEWFLKHRTNAPYLIGPDGYYCTDPESGKPMMWDAGENAAKPFDVGFTEVGLSGRHTINQFECQPAFDLIREEFNQYTPEWAETICTVPAKTIRRIAREFVDHAQIGSTIEIDGFEFPFRPVSLNTERNVTNHRGGTYADLTGKIINMLVGNIEVPGGCLSNGVRGPWLEPGEDGIVRPFAEAIPVPFSFPPEHIDSSEFYPNSHTKAHLIAKAILEPDKYYHDYEIKAWMTIGSNPIRNVAQPQVFVDAFKKIPFHFAISVHMDEPTILADVVFPEHVSLERSRVEQYRVPHQSIDDEVNGLHMLQFRDPVPALFNTRHTDDIIMELAERLGILYGEGGLNDHLNRSVDTLAQHHGLNLVGDYRLELNHRYSLDEIFNRKIRGWIHNREGWDLDALKKAGFLIHRVPRKEFYNYYHTPGDRTRHPFYFQALKESGDTLRDNLRKHRIAFPGVEDEAYIFDLYRPIPHWVENSEFRAPEDFDLYAINWKTPYHANDVNNLEGNPWLAALTRNDPTDGFICINTLTAAGKGLQEGDQVVVESRYGKVSSHIHLSELFHPDAIGIAGGHGCGTIQSNPLNRKGPHFNALLPIDDRTVEAVSGGIEIAPRVKIYKMENWI